MIWGYHHDYGNLHIASCCQNYPLVPYWSLLCMSGTSTIDSSYHIYSLNVGTDRWHQGACADKTPISLQRNGKATTPKSGLIVDIVASTFPILRWGPLGQDWKLVISHLNYIWLVVGNIFYDFPYVGNNNPNWVIFFRGAGIPPTRHVFGA